MRSHGAEHIARRERLECAMRPLQPDRAEFRRRSLRGRTEVQQRGQHRHPWPAEVGLEIETKRPVPQQRRTPYDGHGAPKEVLVVRSTTESVPTTETE